MAENPTTERPDHPARAVAWQHYRDGLGDLTMREEDVIQRAFCAGWSARDPRGKGRGLIPEIGQRQILPDVPVCLPGK